jgi:putative heme-binding domain-containing protein
MLDPSKVIHEKYRTMQFILVSGKVISGVLLEQTPDSFRVAPNLLDPERTISIKRNEVEEAIATKLSAMPAGLLNVLTREEVFDLVSFVEAGDSLPPSLQHAPPHGTPGATP